MATSSRPKSGAGCSRSDPAGGRHFVGPAIDSVAGLEVLTRAALKIDPRPDESYETAVGLNVSSREAQRLTMFNERIGYQYKEKLGSGLSWIEIARQPRPLRLPLRVPDAAVARDVGRLPRPDADYSEPGSSCGRSGSTPTTCCATFPGHKDVSSSRASPAAAPRLARLGDARTRTRRSTPASTPRSPTPVHARGRRVAPAAPRAHPAHEILYYVPTRAEVLRFDNGAVVQFDRNNPMHLEALRRDMAEHQVGMTRTGARRFSSDRTACLIAGRGQPPALHPDGGVSQDSDGSPMGSCAGCVRRRKRSTPATRASSTTCRVASTSSTTTR